MTNKWENRTNMTMRIMISNMRIIMTNLRVINNKYDHDNYAALAIMNGRIDLQKEPFIIGDN